MAQIGDMIAFAIDSKAADFETAFQDIMNQKAHMAVVGKYAEMFPNGDISHPSSMSDMGIPGDD